MASGGAAKRAKRKKWHWSEWYGDYLACGVFPDEFATALQDLFQVVRRSLPDTAYGPWNQDRRQELFCDVMNAIAHSRSLTDHYHSGGWGDKQLFGYFRRIMENQIRAMRKRDHPSWYWMLDRINEIAKKSLAIIDTRKRTYVIAAWHKESKTWEEVSSETLEDRLGAVQPFGAPQSDRMRLTTVEKAVYALFEASRCPIPLEKLVRHSLRILGVNDLQCQAFGAKAKNGDGEAEQEFADNNGYDPTVELEIVDWLPVALAQLSATHLAVTWYFFYDERCDTFERVANRCNALLPRQISGETARNLFHEATTLMRPSASNNRHESGSVLNSPNGRDAFMRILAECIRERLRCLGIDLELLSNG